MVALRSGVFACLAGIAGTAALAQQEPAGPNAPGANGSSAFCLLQVPADDPSRQRWINLGNVQYVETADSELRVIYGGGNFGAGYELRLVYGSPEEAAAQVERMRRAAAACAGR